MRPDILAPLFRPVSALPGIGDKLEKTLSTLLIRSGEEPPARVIDLLLHLPHAVVDRSLKPSLADAVPGTVGSFRLRVERVDAPRGGRAPIRVTVGDDAGSMLLVFFHGKPDWVVRQLPEGAERIVSGAVEMWNGVLQIAHPDYILPPDKAHDLPEQEPVYPLTAGLSAKILRKAIAAALSALPPLPEWLDPALVEQQGWPGFADALKIVHSLTASEAMRGRALARLSHDTFFAHQLALALSRRQATAKPGAIHAGDGHLAQKVRAALPFALTGAQLRVEEEIAADLARPERMVRLLQGDVGAGKTVVAALAMARAAEMGGQSALMAPTEVLARQHAATLTALLEPAGLRAALLTGREKGKTREAVLSGLADGTIACAVGTHALIQPGVRFRDLALAIIDEQHRFGVAQRLALTRKGEASDLLLMTATPIPRSLVLSWYGDMDASRLDEKPASRLPIETRALDLDRLGDVVRRLGAAVAEGKKAYWICPLVEESADSDLAAAQERHRHLAELLGQPVALVHGQMKPQEKDEAMERFRSGAARVLVATTVVEVGVDVADATIMIIEHAERFGLSQLHQLRGRVGRGSEASSCLLLYKGPLGETARARLDVIVATEDGFTIAEEDLRLRGEGDLLGTRQSGVPGSVLRLPPPSIETIERARDDARLTIERDPSLAGERGKAIALLFHLLSMGAALDVLNAG
ncbi:MAG: ATP-dependent DNA helicase RecG [Hyphomicrobiaceae bacterium]|nr:ATP-dependent DNA helicase RecG [Hyphomicrobiaceae bacterium]